MIIQCDSCRTRFRLDDSKIKPNGVRVRCTKCQNVFVVSPPPSADDVEVEEVFGVTSAPGGPSGGTGASPESGAAEPPQDADAGGGGFEGLDFSFGVDRSASGEEDGATAGSPEGFEEDFGSEGPSGAGPEAGAAEDGGAGSVPDRDDMPDFGAGIDNDAFESPGDGGLGGYEQSPSPEGEGGESGGWVEEEGGESEAVPSEGFEADDFEPRPSGTDEDALGGPADEGPSGLEEDEAAGSVDVPGVEGDGEGGEGGPFDDFDLSFSEEGGGEYLSETGEGDETGAGEDDWDLASVGTEEAGPPDEPDEFVEGYGDVGGGPVESGAEDDETVSSGDDGGPEEDEDYHGFEAVYREEETATDGSEGDGPDPDYDPAKKVIPFSPGAKKGDERPSAGSTKEFSEVFNHVISREEVFNSSLALDDDDDDEGEFEIDEDSFETPGAGPARPSRLRLGLLIAGLIIALGGGGLYASGVIDTLTRAIVSGPAASDTLGIERLNGYVVENGKFGAIFAIEAVVKNKTDEPQEIKSIRGVLTGKRGTLAERSVSPGRVLSADDLENLPKAAIEKHFSDPSGGTIPPRGIIPVMVVFTDMPSGVGEFGIDIVR